MEIFTRCQLCKRTRVGAPGVDVTEGWPAISGFRHCIEWLDDAAAPEGHLPFGVRREPPATGDRHQLLVGFPFQASDAAPFWAMFEPHRRRDEDTADQITLVRCQLREDLGSYGGTWPDSQAHSPERRIGVEVLETVPLLALPARLPATGDSPFTPFWEKLFEPHPARTARAWRNGVLSVLHADVEGDIGASITVAPTARGPAIILYGEWSMCLDGQFQAGHHPISEADFDALRVRCSSADGDS